MISDIQQVFVTLFPPFPKTVVVNISLNKINNNKIGYNSKAFKDDLTDAIVEELVHRLNIKEESSLKTILKTMQWKFAFQSDIEINKHVGSIEMHSNILLVGGKGGLCSQLRAQANKMSARKSAARQSNDPTSPDYVNIDSCRSLNDGGRIREKRDREKLKQIQENSNNGTKASVEKKKLLEKIKKVSINSEFDSNLARIAEKITSKDTKPIEEKEKKVNEEHILLQKEKQNLDIRESVSEVSFIADNHNLEKELKDVNKDVDSAFKVAIKQSSKKVLNGNLKTQKQKKPKSKSKTRMILV